MLVLSCQGVPLAERLRVEAALALIDVRLLYHFVVGDGPPVSLASRGHV